MKSHLEWRRILIVAVSTGFLVASSTGAYSQEADTDNKNTLSQIPGAPRQAPEIQRLEKMLIGNWDVVATLEPNAIRPKGRKDMGTNRIVLGPGGRSVVENYNTQGDSGTRSALGILWWDEKAQGYRTMFCDNADPGGCSVYDGVGRWEGNELVFNFRHDRGGNRIEAKEVFTQSSPTSFTVQFFESRNGGPYDAGWTVRNTKAE